MGLTPGTKAAKRKKKRDGLFLRGETYYFRRVVDGKRVAVSTECKDRRQAERRRTELDKEMNDGKFGWTREPKKLAPLMDAYLLSTETSGALAPGWLLYFQRLCAAFPGRRMDELTPSECSAFLGARKSGGDAPNYVRAQHIVYRRTWGAAIKDKLITDNPWTFKCSRAIPRERVMSFEEQDALFETLSPSVHRAATVALFTGLRNNELCHLERADVDFVRARVTVRHMVGKGKKGRVVPMPAEAAAAIREQMADFDTGEMARMFPKFRDGELRIFTYAPHSLVNAFKRRVDALNLPALTIHDLRRTFATRAAEDGVPMRVLQKILGHSDISMTAKFYTNVDEHKIDYLAGTLKASREALARVRGAKVLPMTVAR